jgi:ABC-type antimicrobial peptide transport system permease subunit
LTGASWQGKDPKADYVFKYMAVDYDFIETLNIQMAEGRAFSKKFPSDRTEAFILNEKAAALTGMKSPVGEPFSFYGRKGEIIGIIKNFHLDNFYNEIEPLILFILPPGSDSYVLAKIPGSDVTQHLKQVEKTWNKSVPSYPFEFTFLDEEFDRLYRSEKQMGRLFNGFTFLSVFIASLGLFGLASFLSNQRTKEIGIRRVVGASSLDIVKILTREFVLLLALSNIIAWPAAYFFMNKWLNNFAFRTQMQIWIFLFAALAAFAVALISVSYKTIRAATANPVDSLRYE